jgi:hypothetical protein
MDLSDILSSHYYEVYCQETKTYTSKKDSGLYSILNTIVRKIALLELNNFPVEFLKIDYFGQDIYELLFEKKEIKIDFLSISNEEKKFFEDVLTTTEWGLGNDIKSLNFNKYFVDKF